MTNGIPTLMEAMKLVRHTGERHREQPKEILTLPAIRNDSKNKYLKFSGSRDYQKMC